MRLPLWLCVLAVCGWFGCGDDDGAAGDADVADGGPGDAGAQADAGGGADAGTSDGGGSDGSGVDAGPLRVVPTCDPYAPVCATDEKCSIVVDPRPMMMSDVFFGCVPDSTGTVAAGLSCNQSVPLPETDDAATHSCASGTLCIGDPLRSCRSLCGTPDLECDRNAEYCGAVGLGAGVCFAADRCDPLAQTGCDAGDACRIIFNTFGDLTDSCFPLRDDPPPLPVGTACTLDDDCGAGLACSGTLDGMGGFNMGDEACRELCRCRCGGGYLRRRHGVRGDSA